MQYCTIVYNIIQFYIFLYYEALFCKKNCTNLIKLYKGLLYNKIEDRMGQCCAANFTLFSVWHKIIIEAKHIIFYHVIKYYMI